MSKGLTVSLITPVVQLVTTRNRARTEQWAEQDRVREQAQHWVAEAIAQQNAEIQTKETQHAANGKQVLTEAARSSSSGMEPYISDLAEIQVTMMLEQLLRLVPRFREGIRRTLEGAHFVNDVVLGLTQHYAVVHRRSMVYYPQGNGQADGTNKTLQTILRKIVEANRTDWDRKLHSPLWVYQTSYKTSIRSTPFRMVFSLEAVMPSEFIVPSLRIQLEYKLNESDSEHVRVE
jgi:hypothetical protein